MLNIAPCHDSEYALRDVTHDAAAYYVREGESPGRWWGGGAAALGLAGEVDPAALRDLFEGKDPHTGAYLAEARGSSARAEARRAEADLDVGAAASRLELSPGAVRILLRSGALGGEKTAQGRWRVPVATIDAYLAGAPQPPRCLGPLPSPDIDGEYSLADAARVAGVHVSYFKRIVREAAPDAPTGSTGRPTQYVVGRREGERGRWRVTADELARFMAMRTAPSAVPAYDLTFRAPKSVSVLHALGRLAPPDRLAALGLGPSVAAEVVAAHHAAVADALGLLERNAAWVRGVGGRVAAKGFTAALFDHRSSRAGDPLLHTHAVIANVAEGADGRRAALDGSALYAWGSTAGHVYQARLRAELGARLGVRFERPRRGVADVEGVPRAVIEEFSQRRRQLLAAMEAVGSVGPAAAQRATLATRPPKDERSRQSPERIAARAAAVGFGPEELAAVLGRGPQRRLGGSELGAAADRLAGPEGLTARATLVDARDAIRGLAAEAGGGAAGDDLERWAAALLHDGRRFVPVLGAARPGDVIRRADGRRVRAGGVGQRYSTPELLAHEAALVAAHRAGRGLAALGVGAGVATPEAVAAALGGRPTLSGEQAAMVERIVTSGLGVEVVVGGPGSGKTFALGAAAEAWRRSGLRVVGAALQGGAADTLAAEARLDERWTLTALLGRCDRAGANYLRDAVVVVDEAGTADTRQLARLARHAAAAGAKLVLVGDPDQMPEVAAGGAFGHLVATAGDDVVALRENRRQRDRADRDRLDMIREGRALDAIVSAQDQGRWRTAPDAAALRARLVAEWARDPGAPGVDKLMIAPTVAEVERLNAAARGLLATGGRLGAEAIVVELAAPDRAVDRRELRAGDVVRATRNDYGLGVFTGSVGVVAAVDPGRREVVVRFEGGRELALGAAFLEERRVGGPDGAGRVDAPGLAHAYAVTAHGAQGRTVARAYVLVAAAGLHRQGAYVAASRAANETFFYGLTVADPPELDRLDGRSLTEPNDVGALADAMARDASQTMASALEPDAAAVGELAARPAAWLWAERERAAAAVGAGPPLPEALRLARSALAGRYGLDAAALEGGPLTAAMSAALEVRGATPACVVERMVRRGRAAPRELRSARDPVATLVWAARRAAAALAADAPPHTPAHARLRLLDAALARNRQGRIGAAEAQRAGPVAAVLGPLPSSAAGLAAWRRGAAAVVDYRDAAGLHDRDGGEADALARALGRPPAGERRNHYDAAARAVHEARAAMALVALGRSAPGLGPRPPAEVEALARRPLSQLDAELAAARGDAARRARTQARAQAGARALDAAERALADLGAVPPSRRRRGAAAQAHARRRADAEARVVDARRKAVEAAAAVVEGDPDHVERLARAVAVREARLRAAALADPPAWLRHDVGRRAERSPLHDDGEAARLAAAYGDVAVFAERWGGDAGALTLEGVVGRRPSPEAQLVWRSAARGLDANGPERPGVEISL